MPANKSTQKNQTPVAFNSYLHTLHASARIDTKILEELEKLFDLHDPSSNLWKNNHELNLVSLYKKYVDPTAGDSFNINELYAIALEESNDKISPLDNNENKMRKKDFFKLFISVTENPHKQYQAMAAFVYKWGFDAELSACNKYRMFLEQCLRQELRLNPHLKALYTRFFKKRNIKIQANDIDIIVNAILTYDPEKIYREDDNVSLFDDEDCVNLLNHNGNVVDDLKQYYLLKKLESTQHSRVAFDRVFNKHFTVFTNPLVQEPKVAPNDPIPEKKQKLSDFIKDRSLYFIGYVVMMPLTPIINLGASFYYLIKYGASHSARLFKKPLNKPVDIETRKKQKDEFLQSFKK